MGELRNLQDLFIWMLISCAISSTMNRQKRTKIAGIAIVKKLVNQSGCFENAKKIDWKPMESFRNRRCFVSISVCDNPSKSILDTLQFVHVKTGQSSEERSAIVKMTTYKCICCRIAASSIRYCLSRKLSSHTRINI